MAPLKSIFRTPGHVRTSRNIGKLKKQVANVKSANKLVRGEKLKAKARGRALTGLAQSYGRQKKSQRRARVKALRSQ